jgi:hypothetical protein
MCMQAHTQKPGQTRTHTYINTVKLTLDEYNYIYTHVDTYIRIHILYITHTYTPVHAYIHTVIELCPPSSTIFTGIYRHMHAYIRTYRHRTESRLQPQRSSHRGSHSLSVFMNACVYLSIRIYVSMHTRTT